MEKGGSLIHFGVVYQEALTEIQIEPPGAAYTTTVQVGTGVEPVLRKPYLCFLWCHNC
jgi:hypothetical protein